MLAGFEAMRFPTSSAALICAALAGPMPFTWHISVTVA
jgi:hypothetical protein